ncbi:hypothetical protein QE364_000961 [Nocardioides zeae]|uniref:Uncharacterized protein n=1 Tax=Nocardioides zeae TaxID=1457234 RepID=A0ACC6IF28_9ACTN|nr:hypothetical protein [Nocardioides zeae]MDR6174921.1 hypothetical protein [Nocardioides zeae]MDR6209269.1 hypothetical protein [Nocardioides zeae]
MELRVVPSGALVRADGELRMVLSMTGTAGASVDEEPDGRAAPSVNALAQVVADAAPDRSTAARQEDWVDLATDGSAAGPHQATEGAVLSTFEGGASLSTSAGVQVGLPDSPALASPAIADTGLLVLEATADGEASLAVAVTEASASVQLIIPDSSTSGRHEFDITGAIPRLEADGSVTLLSPQPSSAGDADHPSDDVALGFVDVPWAVDANGEAVPTHFEVDGNLLTQVVDVDSTTAFPVVADPDLIFFAKCGAAVAVFLAENSALAGKFWRVFKSRKALINTFKGLKGMKMSTKVKYVAQRLGTEVSKMSGIQDLVTRCTP